jgi:hypothetical protein
MKAGNGMESNMVLPRSWSGPGELKSLGKSCLGSFQQSVQLVIKFLTKTNRGSTSDCLFMYLGNIIIWDQENHRFHCINQPR